MSTLSIQPNCDQGEVLGSTMKGCTATGRSLSPDTNQYRRRKTQRELCGAFRMLSNAYFKSLGLPTLEDILQGELQDPHIPRGSDLAEELVVQGREVCRGNGQPGRNVRPEAVGHVIGLHAKLHPLLFLESKVARQRHVE